MEPDLILDDLEISMDEEALALLEEKSMEVDSLLGTSLANGGVCKQVAVDMESLREPDAVRRVSLASYTDDWSRTNYTVTVEELQDMSQGAKVAIAVGVGLLVAKMVHWIIKSFFGDDDSDGGGGGGGGGGKKHEKRLKEIRKNNQQIQNATQDIIRDFAAQEAAFKLVVTDAFKELGVSVGPPQTAMQLAISATVKPIIEKAYTPYINECIKNPAMSKNRIERIAKDIAFLTDALVSGYGRLDAHLNDSSLKPDDFKITYSFAYPGWPNLDSATAAAHLLNEAKAMCTPDPKLAIPDMHHLMAVDIPFVSFDEVNSDANRERAERLEKTSAELTKKFQAMRAEDTTNQLAALAHLKEAAKTLASLWNISKPYRDNGQAFSKALSDSDIAVTKMLTDYAKRMKTESKEADEKAKWTGWIDKLAAWIKTLTAGKPIAP